ncbi:MAG: energy transducer TonB [Erythrobacter sp.]|uniref:energy transducer TonB n=1 Tax=Erythrobacter sp. TaxID=1042 RepID=UPI0032EAABA3
MFGRNTRRQYPGLYAWYRDNLADACTAAGFEFEAEIDKNETILRRQRRSWRRKVAKGDPAHERQGIVEAMAAETLAKSTALDDVEDEVARLVGLYHALAALFSVFLCHGPAFADGSGGEGIASFERRMHHVRLFIEALIAEGRSSEERRQLEDDNPTYRIWLAMLTLALKRIDGADQHEAALEAAFDPVKLTARDPLSPSPAAPPSAGEIPAGTAPAHPPRLHDPAALAAVMGAYYPSRALREGIEGDVGFRALVDAEGRATQCQVANSSGHALLDEATCKLIARSARFEPARGAAGEALPGEYSGTLQWRLD